MNARRGTRYGRPDKRQPLPPEVRAALDRMREEHGRDDPFGRLAKALDEVGPPRTDRLSLASVWRANRTPLATLLVALCALLAGCTGNNAQPDEPAFRDQAAFETYVAGYLAVDRVSCRKTSETAARCETPSGDDYLVLCETVTDEGGENCAITRNESE